jgi:hypothetical protein
MPQNRISAALSGAVQWLEWAGGNMRRAPGALLVLGLSLHLSATTIPYKSFDDLVKEADAVVSGRVAQVESKYGPDKEIFTFVTLDNVEALAGTYAGPTLTLRLMGGQVGNDVSQIVGSPSFQTDDRVVLFVQGNGRYMVPLVGWTQGVFRVEQDAATGQLSIRDNEGNRVHGIARGRVIKENLARPEAHIIGDMQLERNEPGGKEVGAGLADYGDSVQLSGAAQPTAAALPNAGAPALSYQQFKNAIQQAASGKKGWGRLNSAGPQDFDRSLKGADAAVEANAAPRQAAEQNPTLPKPTPITPADDQR